MKVLLHLIRTTHTVDCSQSNTFTHYCSNSVSDDVRRRCVCSPTVKLTQGWQTEEEEEKFYSFMWMGAAGRSEHHTSQNSQNSESTGSYPLTTHSKPRLSMNMTRNQTGTRLTELDLDVLPSHVVCHWSGWRVTWFYFQLAETHLDTTHERTWTHVRTNHLTRGGKVWEFL